MCERRVNDRGFTLVEVLVAMLILMGGAMAAAGLFVVYGVIAVIVAAVSSRGGA